MQTQRRLLIGLSALLVAACNSGARAAQPSPGHAAAATNRPALVHAPPAGTYPEAALGSKLLWYVPNRLIDFADIFRLRVRFGPGLAAGMRFTDFGAFYAGEYRSVYAGLPGPRNPHYVRLPAGVECLKGVAFGGVDATDDTPYGPAYGPTEVDFGAHLLIVGADVGVDPLEIADFLYGFVLFDLERDDYPRPRKEGPVMTSAVSRETARGMFRLDEKPAGFESWTARLDYLHTNVQQRVSRPVRATDEHFAPRSLQREEVPDSRLRLGLYSEFVGGRKNELTIKPDADIDVTLPNLENRLHVFVQSARADDLPGKSLLAHSSRGLILGMRRLIEDCAISADAGLRATWGVPRAYARLTWHPMFGFEQWSLRPQQRIFFDTRDNLGSLSTLYVDRWLGDGREYYVGSISSAKYLPFKERDGIDPAGIEPGEYVPRDEDLTWEQTFRLGRVRKMLEKRADAGMYERRDIASGGDLSASVFGTGSHVDTYRFTVGIRRPLYQDWIVWEVEPGLEWAVESGYDTAFRITLGVDMLFWGPPGK